MSEEVDQAAPDLARVVAAVETVWMAAFGDHENALKRDFWDLGGTSTVAANLAFDLCSLLEVADDDDAMEALFTVLFSGPTPETYAAQIVPILGAR